MIFFYERSSCFYEPVKCLMPKVLQNFLAYIVFIIGIFIIASFVNWLKIKLNSE